MIGQKYERDIDIELDDFCKCREVNKANNSNYCLTVQLLLRIILYICV